MRSPWRSSGSCHKTSTSPSASCRRWRARQPKRRAGPPGGGGGPPHRPRRPTPAGGAGRAALQHEPAGAADLASASGGWRLGVRGAESAEFLISANPGEDLRPLGKVISGGELSRTMLAVKTILATADDTPTLVFDEVDAGIGGRAGRERGENIAPTGTARREG